MAVQTEEHYNAGDLRARKEAAGSKAATALAQLTGMAGQMGSAPRTIADTVGNQRSEGLKSLSDRATELRSDYYPEIFRQLSTIGTGAADMSPEAALATSIASYNRAGGAYNQANDLIRNYQGTTEQLGNQAMQGLQAQYSALGDVANQQRATEGNLADRVYRGEQLNEQQRQFDIQTDMQRQQMADARAAAARAASGGGIINGGQPTPEPPPGLTLDKNGNVVDGAGNPMVRDDKTGEWVRADSINNNGGGSNWSKFLGAPVESLANVPIGIPGTKYQTGYSPQSLFELSLGKQMGDPILSPQYDVMAGKAGKTFGSGIGNLANFQNAYKQGLVGGSLR